MTKAVLTVQTLIDELQATARDVVESSLKVASAAEAGEIRRTSAIIAASLNLLSGRLYDRQKGVLSSRSKSRKGNG